jgi:hypothetical protein
VVVRGFVGELVSWTCFVKLNFGELKMNNELRYGFEKRELGMEIACVTSMAKPQVSLKYILKRNCHSINHSVVELTLF